VRDSDFFKGIARIDVPWRDGMLNVPLFYYDDTSIQAAYLTPLDKIRELLPSSRMHPLRVTPWHSVTIITAFAYRDCDIGPYNEVAISFPITIGKPSPVFTGLVRKLPGIPKSYTRHLPVTTEIARDLGVEFANYPKFLADITFEEKDGSLACHLTEAQSHVLTLTVRKLAAQPADRLHMHSITYRESRILRLELILGERRQGISRQPAHAHLELGEHPIAQELRDLNLGRMLYCQYTPQFQAILSPVLESFAGE
jgi:hypothetical protein